MDTQLDPELTLRCRQIADPENQGECLRPRDYKALIAVTVAIPAIMLILLAVFQ